MKTPEYRQLLEQLQIIAHLNSSLAVLEWDQEVFMPSKSADPRAAAISTLSVLSHNQLLTLNKGKALNKLQTWAKSHPNTPEAAVIRETWRIYEREQKLPTKFVKELSALASKAQGIWAEARNTSNFKLFLPSLQRLIELKQQEAEYVGYKDSPYDALLDEYEPGLTSHEVTELFTHLREFLQPFLKTLMRSKHQPPKPSVFKGKFPLEAQKAFNEQMIREIGFDFDSGRLDTSTHPFTTSFHPNDVRLTTRYREQDALYALGSTIHEMGHGLYEQGLQAEHHGTPLGEALSLGVHESQSRLWENLVGKRRSFWEHFYPKLQKTFPNPFKRISLEQFYRGINSVQPSFIRTEADEVTYNLHIILRFELERELIEGTLKAKDLPEIWNAKMKEYLGVDVKNDREGVLQDVHWSGGSIGYFPTYTLGNLYSAQFFAAAKRALPRLDNSFSHGRFLPLREWLREHIHQHGKRHSAADLVKRATGEALNPQYFIDYLKSKYQDIYQLD